MAKRTNKTDHVLNLLAGATKPEDAADTADNKAKPPVDPLEMMNSNVSVHHTSTNGDAPIAEAVKQNLEKELLQDEPDVPPKAAPAEKKGETMQDTISEQKHETSKQESPKEEPVKEETPKQEAPAERTFEFVNVMERLVRDQAERYMGQFGNCMCERCVEDVTALSLSHLPAKCVVVNKEAVSPLLNFYTKKYAGQITVEITKACIIVQENPNH